MAPVRGVEDLGLQPSHVHVVGAFVLAPLAGQAQGEDIIQARADHSVRPELPGHGQAKGVGAAARGVLLVARGDVGRAHRARQGLAAGPDARALLDGVAAAIAQVGIDGRGIDHLTGIHQPGGIEQALELAEGLVEPVTEKAPVEAAAHDAVAVLATPGALVARDQRESLLLDRLHLLDVVPAMHVQHGAHVDQAHAGVRVERHRQAMTQADGLDLLDVLGQDLQRQGGVLDEGHGLAVALDGVHQAQAVLAHQPDIAHRALVEHQRVGITQAKPLEQEGHGRQPFRNHPGDVILRLDDQQRARVALEKTAGVARHQVAARRVDDRVVDQLDGRRPELDDGPHRAERFVHRAEMRHE